MVAEALLERAALEMETGQLLVARRTCLRALEEVRQLGARVLEARGLRILGCIAMALQRDHDAAEHLRQSEAMAARLGAGYEQALALLALAELQTRRPGPQTVHVHGNRGALRQAIALFQGLGADGDLARALDLEALTSGTRGPKASP